MPERCVLQGELGLLSLFDLGQLLMLNRASGELTVDDDGRRGFLYFDQGFIVNAVDDELREGEGAAYRLFTWKRGHFEFVAGDGSGARTIVENTEGLMMEAARRMDESGAGDGSGGELDKLAQRASSLEALREAFMSVASQRAESVEISDENDGSVFALLREPGDALHLRPGQPPRARSGGRWRPAGSQALDSTMFEQIRSRLLEGASASEGGARTRTAVLENGRRFVVTHVAGAQEALWVRAAALAPPSAARLDGDHALLDAVLASRAGLLLAAAPDAVTAERLLHACVARLAESLGGTVLLAADHDRWSHTDRTGALLRASAHDAAELLRAAAPDVAAFDLAHAALAPHALGAAPRVVGAVVSPDAASALSRWCALAQRRWGDGVEAALAGAAIDVVHANSAPAGDTRLAFTVARLAGAPDAAPAAPVPPAADVADEPAPEPAPEVPAGAEAAPAPEPSSAARPRDAMAALAAELTRTLRKAA